MPQKAPFVTALLLVTFHEDHGPTIEAIAPTDNHTLSPAEQSLLAVNALPDSAVIGQSPGDVRYVLHLPRAYPELILAHVLFRQSSHSDQSSKRGAFQKSLVIVSSVPCLAVLDALLSVFATFVFENGCDAVQTAWRDILAWPSIGVADFQNRFELTACQRVISVSVPQSAPGSFAAPSVCLPNGSEDDVTPEKKDLASTVKRTDHGPGTLSKCATIPPAHARCLPLVAPVSAATAAPFHEVNLAKALRGICDKLCLLWELVALAEPILIFAPTPSQSTAAVLAVVGLIHPIPFVGDWQTYMCIQDAMYLALRRAPDIYEHCPNGAVYGVTNPVIVDSLRFPHVLNITAGERQLRSSKSGLATAHRPSLHRMRTLTNALSAALGPPGKKERRTASQIAHDIRACVFEKITRPFLRAFDRYLVPTWGDGQSVTAEPYASDPFGRRLDLLAFDADIFPTVEDLSSPGVMALFKHGANSKNRAKSLYTRFASGPVFQTWWKEARAAATRECVVLHRTDLMEACVRGTGVISQPLSTDEAGEAKLVDHVVDLCLRVKEEKEVAENDAVLIGQLSSLLEMLVKPLSKEVRETVRLTLS